MDIGLIDDWLCGSSVGSMQDLEAEDTCMCMGQPPYDDNLPTGCGRCVCVCVYIYICIYIYIPITEVR